MSNGSVPVIMYHSVGRVLDDWRWKNLTVPVATFAGHLRALESAGYRTATLRELADHVEGVRPLTGRRVVLTFDDGYLDNWSHVFPLLEHHGFTGTVLATVEFVDGSNALRPQLPAGAKDDPAAYDVRAFMSWEELRRAAAGGVLDVQSHAMTHTWYPVSDRVVDFHRPGDGYYWLDWNAHPESKPEYLKHLGESRVPWGVPVYEHEKSLKARRFHPDPAEAAFLADWVSAHGGTSFFAQPQWRETLQRELQGFRGRHAGRGRMETDGEREARTVWELEESRRIIAERVGNDVSFLVWPGGGYDDFSMRIAHRFYRATTVSSAARWRYRNRPGENAGMIVRRGAPSFMIGGRELCAPGAYLVDMLDEFRGSRVARHRRQVRKLALLAAARVGAWPR